MMRWSTVVPLVGALFLCLPAEAVRFVDVGTPLNLPSANCVAWGDYDGDGYADLYIGGTFQGHRAYLLHNDGHGGFTDVATQMGLHTDSASWEDANAAWGDYDNDGRLDLIAVSWGTHAAFLYHNDGTSFSDVAAAAGLQQGTLGPSLAWGDYDGDNWLDLFVGTDLFHSNRDGTFTNATSEAQFGLAPPDLAQSATWVDYNGDGLLDLIVARSQDNGGDTFPARLYHNDGDGTFTDMGLAAGLVRTSMAGVAVGDYDNDGFFDIYFGGNQNRPTVLEHSNGDGTFTNVHDTAMGVSANATGVGWADYDNDGFLDLGQANANLPDYPHPNVPYLFHSNGDGTFSEVSAAEGVVATRKFRGAAWADFNRDGRMDLAMAATDAYSCLFQNTGSPTDGHWLRVRPLTSATGDATDGSPVRDALGARVDVNLDNDPRFPPGRTLARVIDGGSSFLAQNEPVAQFGLGAATTVAVRVRFVDGSVVTRSGIASNQQLEVRDTDDVMGALAGTVTDASTDLAIVGATVTCYPFLTHTDANGRYRLERVPSGPAIAEVTMAGYFPNEAPAAQVVGGQTTTLNFVLSPTGSTLIPLAGTVRDGVSAEPVSGAVVTCGSATDTTGADGAYRLSSLAAGGGYTLTAHAAGYHDAVVNNVIVLNDRTTTIDVIIMPPTGTITGIVTDADTGLPLAGATVTSGIRTATSGEDGGYVLSVVPIGTDLSVTASAPGYVAETVSGLSLADGETLTVDVGLSQVRGTIAGVVYDLDSGEALPGATVVCGGQTTTTADDGSYVVTDLLTGDYSVTASAAGYQATTITDVVVVSGQTTTLDIPLVPLSAAAVMGDVRDADTEQPIPNALITYGSLRTLTDANGRYTILTGTAGTVSLGAAAAGHWWSEVVPVALTPGETVTQDFVLAPIDGPGFQFEEAGAGLNHESAIGAAWGDYDDDGYPDLFLTGGANMPHGLMLYHNDHDLTFTWVGESLGISAAPSLYDGTAWADYDNDGALDVAATGDSVPAVLLDYNGHVFTNVAASAGVDWTGSGRTATWADYNRDNWPDLFLASLWGRGDLYRNDRNGGFTNVTDLLGGVWPANHGGSAWGDLDNDGWLDLVGSGDGSPILYHNNQGTGFTLQPAAFPGGLNGCGGAAIGDYDSDGWLDIALSGPPSRSPSLLHNNQNGTFTDVTAAAGFTGRTSSGNPVNWADYNNDGFLDLFVGGRPGYDVESLYRNNGDGTFTEVGAAAGVPSVTNVGVAACGDPDVDGKIDLFIGGQPTSVLLRNVSGGANWLRVRPLTSKTGSATEGGVPVRDAIGARVDVNVDNDPTFPRGRTLVRIVDGGHGLFGQDEPVAQFGVPVAGPVAVRVMFPDGTMLVQTDVALNRQLEVRDVRGGGDAPFIDVPPDFWAYAAIKACAEAGIVQGYWDFTYRPTESVTRDQMAVYVSRALADGDAHVPSGPAAATFPDVPTEHWAFRYIEYCAAAGVVQGYWDGYRPDAVVTRDQMAVYIARSMADPIGEDGLAGYEPPATPTFADVDSDHWAYRYVEYCSEHGVVQGYWDGTYHPEREVTRDQMAVYIARAFALPM